MLDTTWMCTQEWSLICSRRAAFTFWTCHRALIWSSALTRDTISRSVRLPRTGMRIRIPATASPGAMRALRSTSSETPCSLRAPPRSMSTASRSSATPGTLRHSLDPVVVQGEVAAAAGQQLVVRSLLEHSAVLEHDDEVGPPDRRQPVGHDEGRAA